MDTLWEDGSLFRFQPQYGFITNKTSQLTTEMFECTYEKESNKKSTSSVYILEIERRWYNF